jgi:pantoate--beta-alanine ligase
MQTTATDMKVVTTIAGVREAVAIARTGGAAIGLVPTMGALHEGHVSLIDRAKTEVSCTVLSIFVNPLQFAPNEDLAKYPRPVADDERIAREAGVDILFRPDAREMYPGKREVTVTAGEIASEWEGSSRPGHFDGVLTVVAKLFNIVQPDVAVFGRKDLQQSALVAAMVRDLDMPVRMIIAPIVRERDGLALSSRNRYLNDVERRSALSLSAALKEMRRAFARGERRTTELERIGHAVIELDPRVKTDYLGVVSRDTFTRNEEATAASAAIVAARVGSTRLIDNMALGVGDED